jgi:hypothetical protein
VYRSPVAAHSPGAPPRGNSRRRAWILVLAFAPLVPPAALAQDTGTLAGSVVASGSGEPLADVAITVTPSGRTALSDARGRFLIPGLPAGPVEVRLNRLGFEAARREVTIPAGGIAEVRVALALSAVEVEGLVVSATREAREALATPASIGVVDGGAIREARPGHPSKSWVASRASG